MDNECVGLISEMKTLLDTGDIVSIGKVREWIKSPCLEVQGFVFALLFEYPERLELPTVEEINEFYLSHLERCLREDPEGEYVQGRYMAGHSLRAWFERLWAEKQATEHTLKEIRDMLTRLCNAGDVELNDAIITAILEHLFTTQR